jgi:hypothetical protein
MLGRSRLLSTSRHTVGTYRLLEQSFSSYGASPMRLLVSAPWFSPIRRPNMKAYLPKMERFHITSGGPSTSGEVFIRNEPSGSDALNGMIPRQLYAEN